MRELWKPAIYIKTDGDIIDMSRNIEVSNYANVRFTEEAMKSPLRKRSTPRIQDYNNYVYLKYSAEKYRHAGARLPLHRIVLCSFDPDGWAEGMEVDHIDSNPQNNNLSNLQWLTRQANQAKKRKFLSGPLVEGYIQAPDGSVISLEKASISGIGNDLGFNGKSFQSTLSKGKVYKGYKLIRDTKPTAGG